MSDFTDFIDRLLQLAWTQTWQVAAVVLAVTLVTRLKPVRRRPHLAYALWLLVLAKCLTPPLVASPISPFSWMLARSMAPVVEPALPRLADESPTEAIPDVTTSVPARQPNQVFVDASDRRGERNAVEAPAAAQPPVDVPPAAEPKSPGLTPAAWLLAAWLIGGFSYAGGSLGRYWRTRRRLIRDARANVLSIDKTIAELAQSLRLRRSPRAILATEPFGPAVLGLLRPVLVLPDMTRSVLSPAQLRLVLAHELVHLRRGDHWIGLVQFMAQAIWWFNPLVWWANREINSVREQCCDEEVVARLACEPAGYAQTLLDIVRFGPRQHPLVLAAGVRAMHVTQQRLEHIMSDASRFRRATPRAYWLAAGLAASLLLPGAGLALDQDDSEKIGPEPTIDAPQKKQTVANPAAAKADAHPLTFTGTVIERETKKPIEGAIVTIMRLIRKAHLQNQIVESKHKTDADGRYQFALGAEVQEHQRLLVAPKISHPEFIAMNAESFLVSLAEERMRKGAERVLSPIEAVAARQVSGVIETPDGKPAAGVPIKVDSVYWLEEKASTEGLTAQSETKTDRDGRFTTIAVRDGDAKLMIEPSGFAPRMIQLQKKRGDLGQIRLSPGARLRGRVVDEQASKGRRGRVGFDPATIARQ